MGFRPTLFTYIAHILVLHNIYFITVKYNNTHSVFPSFIIIIIIIIIILRNILS